MSLRRLSALCIVLLFLVGGVLCRIYWVAADTAYAVSAVHQAQHTMPLPRERGNFYDRNGLLLTGRHKQKYALCIPGSNSYSALLPYVSYETQTLLYEKRNTAVPFLTEIGEAIPENVPVYTASQRLLPLPIAVHLIGYLDQDGHGVSGLEWAYDDVLAESGDEAELVCNTTARGTLAAESPRVQIKKQGTGAQVQLTLDANIQRLCEGITQLCMPRGCILVMDTATGEILASVSMPQYDPHNVGKSIRAADTSLVNRAEAAFCVGSVFKVVAAVAAYRTELDWFSCECTGSVEVDGQTYRCAQGRAHGEMNLRGALAESCNVYFVKLGQQLGAQALRQAAKELGFGKSTVVAPGWQTNAGILPEEAALRSSGELALFSFGQGSLTATPLQITAMMNTIAGDGQYRIPRFCRGETDEDLTLTQPLEVPAAKSVCNERTAAVLRSMLIDVVEEGIGMAAKPQQGGAGGKTGTAQTGRYDENGRELLNYWFSGFFPAEEPRYTITILQDDAAEPEFSSAEVFAKIADGLCAMDRKPDDTANLHEQPAKSG